MKYMNKAELLVNEIRKNSPLLVSFSGGVDSSVVAKASFLASKSSIAVTINDITLPKSELKNAEKIAKKIGIKHIIINGELSKKFLKNTPLRCYYCKKDRVKILKKIAEEKGMKVIADGTNHDDLKDIRPGLRAGKEEGIYSPLLKLKFGKKDVREIALLWKLPNHNKPSSACLASRIPYGTKINKKALKRVERAEEYIKKIGFSVVRVREEKKLARIEVGNGEIEQIFKNREEIVKELKKLGYKFIVVDLETYDEKKRFYERN